MDEDPGILKAAAQPVITERITEVCKDFQLTEVESRRLLAAMIDVDRALQKAIPYGGVPRAARLRIATMLAAMTAASINEKLIADLSGEALDFKMPWE